MRALFLVLLGACGTALAADEVSFVNEGVIPAPIDEVWRVFSTSEGYKALGPALAEVDLRVGGVISLALSRRRRARRCRNDRERHRRVPRAGHDGDPHPETARFVPVQGSLEAHVDRASTLTPTNDGTQLRATSYGYGTDEESLAMRRFFEAGNQQTIDTLRRHFGAPTP